MDRYLPRLRTFMTGVLSRLPRASLRTYLVAVLLIATVPLALLLSFQIFDGMRAQQNRLDQELERAATALAQSVERDLRSTVEALYVLARNDHLATGDVASLRAGLQRPDALHGSWDSVFVISAQGLVLVDTAEPGVAAPAIEPEQVRRASAAQVSNLEANGRRGWATVVTVPVPVDGRVKYVLGARIDSTHWQSLLNAAVPPADGVLSLFDRDHRLIARTPALDMRVGQRLPDAVIASMAAPEHGVHRSATLEGGEVYRAWRRLEFGRWGVDVGVRTEPFDRAQNEAVLRAMSVVAACLLLGVSLALLLARHLIEPLGDLARGDLSQARATSPVLEIELLGERLRASRAEEAAARARAETKAAEFEALFEGSPIALALAQDRQCRKVVHNAAMDALFGHPAAGDGEMLTVLFQGRPLARDLQPLQRAARTGEAVPPMELEIAAPGRTPHVVLAQAVPLLDSQRRPRGAIGAAADITQHKQAEARLLQSDRALRESQRLVDLAQEAGHVGFFSYDFERDALIWSPGQARLFGLQGGAVSLRQWVERIDADHRVHVHEGLEQMLAQRRENESLDYRITLGTGATRWLSSRFHVQYDSGGQPRQMLGVTVDVTEQKQIEHERAEVVAREQAARIEAERANRAKDEFLAILGHELRNPLGAIVSAVEVLGSADAGSGRAASARAIVSRQTRNLARMLDDLLEVARVISGKVLLSRQPLDLAALVQRVVATLQLGESARGHDISLDLRAAWVDADATRIEQVVMNLLTNALKYTPPGSRIELTLRRERDVAVLRVGDNGPGIAPELLPQVFDLFVQGERGLDRRAGGLGVGLSLVRRLVEMHGGSVGAESSTSGTVFEVRLDTVEPPGPDESDQTPVAAGNAASRRIVLIEDNADAGQALRARLEIDGHAVEMAADGLVGLELVLERRPDVAIVDLGLPGLTGFDVALRSRGAGYAGLMVAISGYGQEDDVRRALRSGFDALLVKPVDSALLRRLLAGRG